MAAAARKVVDPSEQVLVVKLGGSLITHKARYCEADVEQIDLLGHQLAALLADDRRFVIVLGGGSFGNQIPVRYLLLDARRRRKQDLPRMTAGMQQLCGLVCSRWWELGIPAHPLQLAAMLWREDGQLKHDFSALVCALSAGLTPVLTGDMILSTGGDAEVFSSDRLVEILPHYVRVRRNIMLTDVEGVRHRGELLKQVNIANVDQVMQSCGASGHPDITGGMKSKLAAMWTAASLGVPGTICSGHAPENLARAVLGEQLPGTSIEAIS